MSGRAGLGAWCDCRLEDAWSERTPDRVAFWPAGLNAEWELGGGTGPVARVLGSADVLRASRASAGG